MYYLVEFGNQGIRTVKLVEKEMETDIEVLAINNQWSCDTCNKKRRLSHSNSDSVSVATSLSQTSSANMAITMDMKKEIMDGQVNIERALGKSLEHCSVRIDENNTLIKNQQEIINEQQKMIVGLMEENKLLKAQLKDMSLRQSNLEQYSRRNTVKIFGVPESADENYLSLKKTVIEIGKALGVKLTKYGIESSHRISGGKNRSISGKIVTFLRHDDPDQLLARWKVKWEFSIRHLQGYNTDQQIYINPSLTPVRRVLLANARRLTVDFNYKFVSDDTSSSVIVPKDEDDLNALVQRELATKSMVRWGGVLLAVHGRLQPCELYVTVGDQLIPRDLKSIWLQVRMTHKKKTTTKNNNTKKKHPKKNKNTKTTHNTQPQTTTTTKKNKHHTTHPTTTPPNPKKTKKKQTQTKNNKNKKTKKKTKHQKQPNTKNHNKSK
ncbi:hypothetical protein J6590_013703 [Homalodisca vitripennis]|nr:hypothetical protein J6590_013703 [Homalodisca vitripennis]